MVRHPYALEIHHLWLHLFILCHRVCLDLDDHELLCQGVEQ